MPGLIRLLLAAALGLALTWSPAAAQDIRIEPIPPRVKPQWTPVPNAPGVSWAPNIPTDVFRHGTKYYFYWQGYLYQGSKSKGPWKSVDKIPAWFSEIDPSYFKTAQKEEPAAPPIGGPAGLTPAPPPPAPGMGTPAAGPEKEGAPPAGPAPEKAPGAPAMPPPATASPKVM